MPGEYGPAGLGRLGETMGWCFADVTGCSLRREAQA
jgi:hypothetical protein